MDDSVNFHNQKPIARFNHMRALMRLWQIIEVAIIFATISWCPARAPALVRSTAVTLFEFSDAFNRHVAFLIGNAIILLLFILCRQGASSASAAAARCDNEEVKTAAEFGGDGDKQNVASCAEETVAVSQCDDVKAVRREIAVRPELRRSYTESRRKTVSSVAAEIDNLSSEEFRRRIDAFIDENWGKSR